MMPTRDEVAMALRAAMVRIKYENELPGYMGIYAGATWVYDTPDGRKWVRVPQGDDYVPKMAFLLDASVPDDYTQPVWVTLTREGYWAITRPRIEGY